jgi:hypothetical protein
MVVGYSLIAGLSIFLMAKNISSDAYVVFKGTDSRRKLLAVNPVLTIHFYRESLFSSGNTIPTLLLPRAEFSAFILLYTEKDNII